MENITQEIARFAVDVTFDDIPQDVMHESKRLILDSIGCALAGMNVDKGKIAAKMGKRLGGPPESTIIGIPGKVSCSAAAFANGELVNALDYDAAPGGHTTPFVLPAPLALAEHICASGKDLIVANTVAHEVAIRVSAALPRLMETAKEGSEAGAVSLPRIVGYGHCIFGGTIGAGKILGFDREKMVNSMGIAASLCPIPHFRRWSHSLPLAMAKYCMAGGVCQAEVMATSLAEMGYAGDIAALDSEHGFWELYNSNKWQAQVFTDGLGKEWNILKTFYKLYPCCGAFHTALACFTHILEENALTPEDIERVVAFLPPLAGEPAWNNRQIVSHVDAQFSTAYVFAVAAHKLHRMTWQDKDTIRDPKMLNFMDRVSYEPYPDWGKALIEDPTSFPAKVEVWSGKGKFSKEKMHVTGVRMGSIYSQGKQHTSGEIPDSQPEATGITDQLLVQKFRENASPFLVEKKIDTLVDCILNLENLDNIEKLMELVVP